MKFKKSTLIQNDDTPVDNTEQQVDKEDTIPIMVNGEKINLSQGEYDAFKRENNAFKERLKTDIKTAAKEYDDFIKSKLLKNKTQ